MKAKIIIISIFAFFTLALSTFEIVYTSNTFADISESSKEIIKNIEEKNEKNLILENLNQTYENWKSQQKKLCLIYNHKDLLEIGKELNQAISYVDIDNNSEAYVHMLLLQEDLENLEQIIRFDISNIF